MRVEIIYKAGNLLPKGEFILHSKFQNVINFINAKQQILSFAFAESYLSPNTLLINSTDFSVIKKVIVDEEKIELLGKYYFLDEIEQYNSFFIYRNNGEIDLKSKVIKFEQEFLHRFNKKSLAFLLNIENEKYFTSTFDKAFVKYIKLAYNEIENGDFYTGIGKMKGAGFGLTPSGDDFIAGMLFAFDILRHYKIPNINTDTEKIKKIAIGKNPISNSLLYYASKGSYYKRFKDFQEALLYKESEIENTFNELIKIGETSSSDMLAGFILTTKKYFK